MLAAAQYFWGVKRNDDEKGKLQLEEASKVRD